MINRDDLPLGALAVVALLVSAAVLMPASLSPPGTENATNGTVTQAETRPLPENISEQLYPVPESHTEAPSTSSGVPEVAASTGSQTMQVTVREEDGVPKMVLDDGETHSGRWVSVPTDWIRETGGDVPSMVTVDHSENGEYHSKLYTQGDSSTFYVRSFSTNTVTFSADVSVTANAATDGTTLTYDVGDLSDPSGYEITATGVKSTEAETESWTGVSSLTADPQIAGNSAPENVQVTFTGRAAESNTFWEGTTSSATESTTIDISGTTEPTNQTVTFTGRETTTANTWSATSQSSGQSTSITVGGNTGANNPEITFTGRETTSSASSSGTGSGTVSVGGNAPPENQQVTVTGEESTNNEAITGSAEPTGASNSFDVAGNLQPENAEITITGRTTEESYNTIGVRGESQSAQTNLFVGVDSGAPISSDMQILPQQSGTLNAVTVDIEGANVDNYNPEIDIYVAQESPDATYGEGTLVKSGWNPATTIGEQSVSFSNGVSVTGGTNYTVSFVPTNTNSDSSFEAWYIYDSDVETGLHVHSSGNSDYYRETPDISAEVSGVTPAGVTATTDNSGSSVSVGDLSDGQTVTKAIGITKSDTAIQFSADGAGGSLDYNISYDEVTATEDPSVDVDGDGTTEATWTGIYSSGETTTSKSVTGLSTGSNSLTTATSSGPQPSWTVDYDEIVYTEGPSVDVDGDGMADASYAGVLDPGQSSTVALQNLPDGGVTVTTTTTAGIADWSISADEVTATEDPSVDIGDDGTAEASHTGVLLSGETATVALNGLTTGSNTIGIDANSAGTGWRIEATTVAETTDPSLDVGNDGTTEASYAGTLSQGESVTRSVSVSSIPSIIAVETTSGGTDVDLSFTEVTTTPGGNLSVNGNTPSTWTALAPGTTTQLATNSSWVTQDQNSVDIAMDDSGLSADAPAAKVDINYTHTAKDPVSASVSDEKWSQRYTISKTWGADQTNARVTVPLKDNVIDVRALTKSENGGAYTAIDPANYTLDTQASELTVQFGDVTAGDSVTVRANMTKVQVQNGDIEVIEPTLASNTLNSEIKLTNWQQTSYIAVDGTKNADHTIYTANESWSTVDSTYYVDAAGNRQLRMPNAASGATTEVKSTPLQVTLPDGGEVALEVIEADDNEPKWRVESGTNSGDTVKYKLLNGRTDGTHVLFGSDGDELSSTGDRTLTYDDTADTYSIQFTTNSLSTGGGGGGLLAGSGGGMSLPIGALGGTFVPLIGVALALAGLVVASRDDEAVESAGDGAASTTQSALDNIPVVGPAVGGAAAGAIRSGSQFAQAAVRNRTVTLALGGAIVAGAVQLGIVQIPEGSGTILIVAGIGVGSLVALRELDEFSTERWAALVTAATVVAIQTQSDASLLTAIVESQVFPIVIIGALYLAYRFVQGIRQPDNVTEVVVDGNDGGGE